ncbi:MAG: hypothetical protein BAA04_03350 [Firmicutes bacterium ZCTH02-B6]|nr:MAG: hypothetical protein BAA04_03350 [Firmicutes bacterium ZCTH02-B6]
MRFVKVIVLAVTLLAVAAWPSMVQAADSKFEFYGGVTHNTINLKYSGGESPSLDQSTSGVGWHVGGRYWFNDRFAAGLMVDSFGFKFSNEYSGVPKEESEISATGYLAVVDYQVAAQDNWRALLEAGVGSYSGRTNKVVLLDEQKIKSAVGFLVGARLDAELTEHLSLEAVVNYRSFSADLDKPSTPYPDPYTKVDANGFAIGVGLVYSF